MSNKNKNTSFLSKRTKIKKKVSEPSILKSEDENGKRNWTQVFIFVILLYASMSFMNGCFSILDLKAQENDVVAQTQAAEQKKKALENEASYLQTEEAIEKTAREDLNMVKPGEILLTQRNKAASKENTTTEETTTVAQSDMPQTTTDTTQSADTTADTQTQAAADTTADVTQSSEQAAADTSTQDSSQIAAQ